MHSPRSVSRNPLSLLALAAALAGLCLAFSACGPDSADEPQRSLTIYVSQPTTGGRGGRDTIRAVEIAVANQGSRIGEAEIRVVGLNDADPEGRFDPALVRANARRAAEDPTTIAYIGEFDSSGTEIAMPILNRAGILHVSSGSTAVKLTRPSPAVGERLRPTGLRTFARVVPNDTVQSAALTQFMQEESVGRVFVVDDGGTYGLGLKRYFDRLAELAGIEIVGTSPATPRTDMVALAETVDESGADAVLYAGSDLETGLNLFEAISRASIHVKLFGGDGISLTGFLDELGDAELDTYVTAPMLPAGNYAISGESFFERFRDRHGEEAEPMSIFGYEAGDAVMDSIRAGVRGDIATQPIATLRNDTRDAFFSISERPSALGSYSIDANGDTTLTFYGAYRVEGGELVLGRAIDVPGSLLQEVE
jgi:branched-chain amino acid transport system substrate-binding protein